MTPTEFLEDRNIVAEDKTDLIIGFDNGTKESLIELLDSYHQAKLKLLDIDFATQQRELLFSFMKTYNDSKYDSRYEIPEFMVKDFLENYSL